MLKANDDADSNVATVEEVRCLAVWYEDRHDARVAPVITIWVWRLAEANEGSTDAIKDQKRDSEAISV